MKQILKIYGVIYEHFSNKTYSVYTLVCTMVIHNSIQHADLAPRIWPGSDSLDKPFLEVDYIHRNK